MAVGVNVVEMGRDVAGEGILVALWVHEWAAVTLVFVAVHPDCSLATDTPLTRATWVTSAVAVHCSLVSSSALVDC